MKGETIHVRFTESEQMFRHTFNAETGVGTFQVARGGGQCELVVTYDAGTWTCACGDSGETTTIDADALAHMPGENRS